ncbi:MAG: GDP-mannose mannosyl hydrolase [Candidatus Kaiserbacteria bacterium]|nr:GDP-mannose mannosyl hydrolase [Candidatus Kaiserbacteria bacterium]
MELQVGAKILLKNKEGKYLLIKRSADEKHGVGKWDIPGGRLEAEMSLMDNLVREIREETGFSHDTKPVFLTVQDMMWPDRHVIRLVYTGIAEGDPVLSHEHTEFKWMTAEEIKKMTDLEFDRYLSPLFADGTLT